MTKDRVTLVVMKQTDLDAAGAERVRARRRAVGRCEECGEARGHSTECESKSK